MKLKTIIGSIAFVIFVACGDNSNSNVKANKTAELKVLGNCNMCKETIEGSLIVDGVAKADWDSETNILKISFDSTKINLDKIAKNVAAVGYDNEKYKADDETYSKLHECCQYERK